MSRWAKVDNKKIVEVAAERPETWTDSQGRTVAAGKDVEVEPELLNEAGWYEVKDDEYDQETEEVIDERLAFKDTYVQATVVTRPKEEPEPEITPNGVREILDARIDAIEALFTEIRDRTDAGLHEIETVAAVLLEMREAINEMHKFDDRLLAVENAVAAARGRFPR